VKIFDIFGKSRDNKMGKNDIIHPETYNIRLPEIKSGSIYHFTTGSGVEYEVRLGNIQGTLRYVINFNVQNDEYSDDEYAITNKGELYRVISTVIKIMKIYLKENPYVRGFEFSGEYKPGNEGKETSIRTRMFYRAVISVFSEEWAFLLEGNKVTMTKRNI